MSELITTMQPDALDAVKAIIGDVDEMASQKHFLPSRLGMRGSVASWKVVLPEGVLGFQMEGNYESPPEVAGNDIDLDGTIQVSTSMGRGNFRLLGAWRGDLAETVKSVSYDEDALEVPQLLGILGVSSAHDVSDWMKEHLPDAHVKSKRKVAHLFLNGTGVQIGISTNTTEADISTATQQSLVFKVERPELFNLKANICDDPNEAKIEYRDTRTVPSITELGAHRLDELMFHPAYDFDEHERLKLVYRTLGTVQGTDETIPGGGISEARLKEIVNAGSFAVEYAKGLSAGIFGVDPDLALRDAQDSWFFGLRAGQAYRSY